jgi:hypothetical protein
MMVAFSGMKLVACLALLSLPAVAQGTDPLFSQGKPPVFKESDKDRRFGRSKFARALSAGTEHPGCAQLQRGMLTVLAEMGPWLHKKDENLYVDPYLWQAAATQLSSANFPAQAYVVLMMRRVLIDGKLPEAWLLTAEKVNGTSGGIDLARLRYLLDGLRPIDSWGFTLEALTQAYEVQVLRANALGAADAVAAFRDTYLDREVAWGGLVFRDVGLEEPPKAKGKKKKKSPEPEQPPEKIAHLIWNPPDPHAGQLNFFGDVKRPPPRLLTVKLQQEQYVDLQRIPRGSRVMVRGRFWEMSPDTMQLEIREGLLFLDRDFSRTVLADPSAVATCPDAVNELSGVAPQQPGGFGQH